MFDYWIDHPPLHEMVAAYLGVKPRNRMTAHAVLTTAPEGCMTVEELKRIAAANPMPV